MHIQSNQDIKSRDLSPFEMWPFGLAPFLKKNSALLSPVERSRDANWKHTNKELNTVEIQKTSGCHNWSLGNFRYPLLFRPGWNMVVFKYYLEILRLK